MGLIGDIGSFIGGFFDRDSNQKIANENNALQREFAQNGIRWKVEDAKAAGIHPLAALGAQTLPFTPAFGDNMGTSFASMGQDIGRAIDSTRTGEERNSARITALQVERGELENELLRSQIHQLNQNPPPMPTAGDSAIPQDLTKAGLVKTVPVQIAHTEPGQPAKEAGVIPDYTFTRTADGAFVPVPSDAMKQKMEDNFLPETLWSIRNNFLPNIGSGPPPPPRSYLPEGFNSWKWSIKLQGWIPIKVTREELEKKAIGGSDKKAIKPNNQPFLDRSRR